MQIGEAQKDVSASGRDFATSVIPVDAQTTPCHQRPQSFQTSAYMLFLLQVRQK